MLIGKAVLALAVTAAGLQQQAGVAGKLAAVELGNSVAVSENGYQQVAAQKSDEEMKAFIHRVLAAEARYVSDVAELNGLVPFYSGTQNSQNLESLKEELRKAPWVAEGEGRTAPLNDFGYQKVASLKSNAHMMAFARRILNFHNKKCSDEGAFSGIVPYFSGAVSVQNFGQLSQELLSAPWVVTPGKDVVAGTLSVALSEKTKEDPEAEEEPVETTLATTTTAATTTVVTTTLATTTLATTTLATTTLATTTVLTTLVTTTLPTTTLAEEEEEVEEALFEESAVTSPISKHDHVGEDEDDDHSKVASKKATKANGAENGKVNGTKGDAKDFKADATKEMKANATKDAKANATTVSGSKKKSVDNSDDAEKGDHSLFGWLMR